MSATARTWLLTAVAMLAFAGNSVLSRLALGDGSIGPAGFTVIRLAAGAITLVVLVVVRQPRSRNPVSAGSWRSAVTLVVYAVCFSWAYVRLDAATGALILFGTVQCTMITAGLLAGERPGIAEVAGWLLAAAGMLGLLLPGAATPPVGGALLMMAAGIGWGLYSLHGRGVHQPLRSTAGNFVRALPLLVPLVVLGLVAETRITPTLPGVLVAILAGSVTTGLGYIVWYAALPALTSLQAALVQLSVPVLAAAGGIALLAEIPDLRLLVCGSLVLGGIWFATTRRRRPPAGTETG